MPGRKRKINGRKSKGRGALIVAKARIAAIRNLLLYSHKSLAHGALVSTLLVAVGTVLSYPVQIFVARTLGVQEYGTYSYVLASLYVLSLIVSLDLGSTALRFVGIYNSAGKWPLLRGFVRTSRGLVLALSAAAAVGGAIIVIALQARLEPGFAAALLAACVLLVPMSLLSLEFHLLLALGRVYEVRIPSMFVRPLVFAAILFLATHTLGAEPSAATAILANAAGSATALALSLYLWIRIYPSPAREVRSATRPSEWLRFSGVSLGSNVMSTLLSQHAAVIIVGTAVSTNDAGLYSAASQILSIVVFGVITVSHFASPRMAEYRLDGRLRVLVRGVMILSLVLSLPAIAALLLVGDVVLRTFGPEFVAAYPVIVVLSIGYAVNAVWGQLWGDLLTMTGFHRKGAALVVSMAALNIALMILLTPRFGIIGAAAAASLTLLMRGIIAAIIVHQCLGFWPWTVFRREADSA